MPTTTTPAKPGLTSATGSLAGTSHAVEDLADRAAVKAESAIDSTRKAVNSGLDSLESGVDELRSAAPTAFSRAAAQVEELTRRSVDRARDAGQQVKEQVTRAQDVSVGYIRDEPVKSVLIAAATGAAVAILVGWLARSRSDR